MSDRGRLSAALRCGGPWSAGATDTVTEMCAFAIAHFCDIRMRRRLPRGSKDRVTALRLDAELNAPAARPTKRAPEAPPLPPRDTSTIVLPRRSLGPIAVNRPLRQWVHFDACSPSGGAIADADNAVQCHSLAWSRDDTGTPLFVLCSLRRTFAWAFAGGRWFCCAAAESVDAQLHHQAVFLQACSGSLEHGLDAVELGCSTDALGKARFRLRHLSTQAPACSAVASASTPAGKTVPPLFINSEVELDPSAHWEPSHSVLPVPQPNRLCVLKAESGTVAAVAVATHSEVLLLRVVVDDKGCAILPETETLPVRDCSSTAVCALDACSDRPELLFAAFQKLAMPSPSDRACPMSATIGIWNWRRGTLVMQVDCGEIPLMPGSLAVRPFEHAATAATATGAGAPAAIPLRKKAKRGPHRRRTCADCGATTSERWHTRDGATGSEAALVADTPPIEATPGGSSATASALTPSAATQMSSGRTRGRRRCSPPLAAQHSYQCSICYNPPGGCQLLLGAKAASAVMAVSSGAHVLYQMDAMDCVWSLCVVGEQAAAGGQWRLYRAGVDDDGTEHWVDLAAAAAEQRLGVLHAPEHNLDGLLTLAFRMDDAADPAQLSHIQVIGLPMPCSTAAEPQIIAPASVRMVMQHRPSPEALLACGQAAPRFHAVSAAGRHTVAIDESGRVWVWDTNSGEQSALVVPAPPGSGLAPTTNSFIAIGDSMPVIAIGDSRGAVRLLTDLHTVVAE